MVCRCTAASFSAEAASSPSTWDWSRHFTEVDQVKSYAMLGHLVLDAPLFQKM